MVARFTGLSHSVVQLDTGLVDDDHVGSGDSHRTCDSCRQIISTVLLKVLDIHSYVSGTFLLKCYKVRFGVTNYKYSNYRTFICKLVSTDSR